MADLFTDFLDPTKVKCPACGNIGLATEPRDTFKICGDCGHISYQQADGKHREMTREERVALRQHPKREIGIEHQREIVKHMIG